MTQADPLYLPILEEVRQYIINDILIGVSNGNLGPHESLVQKGILNSTGVLELVGYLENRFRISCLDEEITPENLDSLNAIATYVCRKLNESRTQN